MVSKVPGLWCRHLSFCQNFLMNSRTATSQNTSEGMLLTNALWRYGSIHPSRSILQSTRATLQRCSEEYLFLTNAANATKSYLVECIRIVAGLSLQLNSKMSFTMYDFLKISYTVKEHNFEEYLWRDASESIYHK